MLSYIYRLLDSTTMYRVVLYSLSFIIVEAVLFSILGILPYTLPSFLTSFLIILIIGLGAHYLFQKVFNTSANIESTYISIFIAFLVLAPVTNVSEGLFVALAAFLIVASKYVIAHSYRHIFNPVAFGIFVIGVVGSTSVSWWVGSMYFLPSMIVIMLLLVHKLRRQSLVISYLVASMIAVVGVAFFQGQNFTEAISQHVFSWPLIFLGIFMLTEPLTTPPTKGKQRIYGAIIGVLSSIPYAFPPIYSTPELAILIGNIFSFAVSTKSRVLLTLVEKKEIAKDTYEFTFSQKEKVNYLPGQYMEWTLPHTAPDLRGIRRYFTIASSPKEEVIRLGIKKADKGSTFKNALFGLEPGQGLLSTAVMGDFLLPDDANKKLVFIAGGIGITPFVSMIRTLVASGGKRDIVLFYANKKEEEIAYKDILEKAVVGNGLRVVQVLSDIENIRESWEGEKGFVTKDMLIKYLEDYKDRRYYISGPPGMVSAYTNTLKEMGVKGSEVMTDFFPGFN